MSRSEDRLRLWDDVASSIQRPAAPRRGPKAIGHASLPAILTIAAATFLGAVGIAIVLSRPADSGVLPTGSPTATGSIAPPSASATQTVVTFPTDVPAPTDPDPTAAARPLEAMMVRDGDAVMATGFVCETVDGDTFIHAGSSWFTPAETQCQGVPLTAIDPATVRGWSEEDLVSSGVTVLGTWNDGTVAVTAIVDPVPSDPGRFELPIVTCDPPPGGWLVDQPLHDQGDQEAAGLRLQAVVDSMPGLYSGSWTGWIPATETEDEKHAYVLGTVGDVGSAYSELKPLYPFNLCVTSAQFNASELEAVEGRLRERWGSNAAPWLNRVQVPMIVLDQEAVDFVGDDADKVLVYPFVRKAAQGSADL